MHAKKRVVGEYSVVEAGGGLSDLTSLICHGEGKGSINAGTL